MRAAAATERQLGRRTVVAGDVVRVRGARGRFVVRRFVGDEVDVFGGTPGHERYRCFAADRVVPAGRAR